MTCFVVHHHEALFYFYSMLMTWSYWEWSCCYYLFETVSLEWVWDERSLPLGIEVAYSSQSYLLSQQKYISDILKRATLRDLLLIHPLCLLPWSWTWSFASTMVILYHSPDGNENLELLSFCYSADISHVVHILSKVVSATSTHYATLLRVLRYLRGTMTRSLLFPSDSPFTLRAYSNGGWANDLNTRRSTAGFCVFFVVRLLFFALHASSYCYPVY